MNMCIYVFIYIYMCVPLNLYSTKTNVTQRIARFLYAPAQQLHDMAGPDGVRLSGAFF